MTHWLAMNWEPSGLIGNALHDVPFQICPTIEPAADPRPVLTSVIVVEVADGTWGASGALWHFDDFVKAAGYKHLQSRAVSA